MKIFIWLVDWFLLLAILFIGNIAHPLYSCQGLFAEIWSRTNRSKQIIWLTYKYIRTVALVRRCSLFTYQGLTWLVHNVTLYQQEAINWIEFPAQFIQISKKRHLGWWLLTDIPLIEFCNSEYIRWCWVTFCSSLVGCGCV